MVCPRLKVFERKHPKIQRVAELAQLIDNYLTPHAFVKEELNYNHEDRARILQCLVKRVCTIVDEAKTVEEEEEVLKQWAIRSKPQDYQKLNITGFSYASFQYLRMLFGVQTAKPDRHIIRFLFELLGRDVSPPEARCLLEEASKREGLPVRDVDRFIWDLRAGGQRDTETDLTDCSEFWTPICKGELGELFAGKPESINKKGWMNEGWLGKTVHCDIEMWMRVTNRACYIQLYFYGENPSKSGNEVMALFSQSGYDCKNTDTSTDTRVKFSVLNKGKNDRDDWPEMRKKLVAMGTDIYNKIKESDL